MTVMFDAGHRGWAQASAHGAVSLGDKFEIIKDIGDGSFGSVALGRVRSAGTHVARRNTLVRLCSRSLPCGIAQLTTLTGRD